MVGFLSEHRLFVVSPPPDQSGQGKEIDFLAHTARTMSELEEWLAFWAEQVAAMGLMVDDDGAWLAQTPKMQPA